MSKARPPLILFGLAAIFALGLLVGIAFLKGINPIPEARIANTATIVKQVQGLSQLVTVKYVMEKIVILDDPKRILGVEIPGGDNRVLLLAHGIVKAGIDFEQLHEKDIRVDGKKISITLPPPILTDAYLDEHKTKVIERSTGLMRAFDKDLEQNARRQALGEIQMAARENGITKDAEERARLHLQNLFHQLGFTDVEFK